MTTLNRSKTLAILYAGLASAGLGAVMLGAGSAEQARSEQAKPAVVGQQAPDFTLTDLQGQEHTLSEYTARGKTVVLEWFSPECPFVKKHYRDDTKTMIKIQEDNKDQVVWLRINSGRKGHPSTGIEANTKAAEEWGITTAILLDESGKVGQAYGAKRTPEMYVINTAGVLTYHGAIDNRPKADIPGDMNYVRQALAQTLAGEPVTTPETKAYGCGVKY